ncbi:NAD(P)-dependent malic enzyme [Clostridium formicaceticum]|uniref:NAD-dependent malic enzyme n=1 Tax=Clostridium formicaceticum TaxID=1497 RepID=A0AAC9RH65_9CLOT|nr:malic enzyme-like NAD(P)-binding protein [Clostridium formicaceticum]AOY76507.1 NAD-dependent malic enzyme [Clostridium formicaceticum]ARE86916.1 NAD-dependent malic enzyme [Clostridium formicaceticum]
MKDYQNLALAMHKEKKGKLAVVSKVKLENKDDLSIAYTPGVAEPCREIYKDKENVYQYTSKGNLVAVVTDGTAVLGLGDIGPEAGMPVMEGKAVLFKSFADVDAFPICLDTKNVDEIVETVKRIAPTFGGINLEDISAPRCIEIEERLKKELDIPVFHDDQHGTAIVVSAGLINALKLTDKKINHVRIVVNGAGAAGSAIVKMLIALGAEDIIVCDREGILYKEADTNTNWLKKELAEITNKKGEKGTLRDAMEGADVFIGVSAANVVDEAMIKSMNPNGIVFAMANPTPEIMPDLAVKAGARVVGTGRSDFPNQINNVLAFPGIFRGALDVRATDINEEMKVASAYAIASIIDEAELKEDYVIPNALDKRVAEKVAKAVAEAAKKSGVARS